MKMQAKFIMAAPETNPHTVNMCASMTYIYNQFNNQSQSQQTWKWSKKNTSFVAETETAKVINENTAIHQEK